MSAIEGEKVIEQKMLILVNCSIGGCLCCRNGPGILGNVKQFSSLHNINY